MANLSTAWHEGFDARMCGTNPVGANPYPYISDDFDQFWCGWNAALDVLSFNSRVDDGYVDWREEYEDSRDIPVEELTVRDAFVWMLDGIQIRIHALSLIGKEPMSFDDIPF